MAFKSNAGSAQILAYIIKDFFQTFFATTVSVFHFFQTQGYQIGDQ